MVDVVLRVRPGWEILACPSLFFDVLPRNGWRNTYCMAAATETPVEISLRRRAMATLSFSRWWRHERKLEWLLKEIRSPKENWRLSREAFLILRFFVGDPTKYESGNKESARNCLSAISFTTRVALICISATNYLPIPVVDHGDGKSVKRLTNYFFSRRSNAETAMHRPWETLDISYYLSFSLFLSVFDKRDKQAFI